MESFGKNVDTVNAEEANSPSTNQPPTRETASLPTQQKLTRTTSALCTAIEREANKHNDDNINLGKRKPPAKISLKPPPYSPPKTSTDLLQPSKTSPKPPPCSPPKTSANSPGSDIRNFFVPATTPPDKNILSPEDASSCASTIDDHNESDSKNQSSETLVIEHLDVPGTSEQHIRSPVHEMGQDNNPSTTSPGNSTVDDPAVIVVTNVVGTEVGVTATQETSDIALHDVVGESSTSPNASASNPDTDQTVEQQNILDEQATEKKRGKRKADKIDTIPTDAEGSGVRKSSRRRTPNQQYLG